MDREEYIQYLGKEVGTRLILSERITRNVVLASVLEPIPDKPGATTRFVDTKPSKALELFISGGVNIGPAFGRLVHHLEQHRSAAGSYRFCYEAMVLSKWQRAGGKINQGIIELLFPIVITQVLYDPNFEKEPMLLLEGAEQVLKQTGTQDVEHLIQMKQFANFLSGSEEKHPVALHPAANIFEYYTREFEAAKARNDEAGVLHNRQFVEAYQKVRLGLKVFYSCGSVKFAEKVVHAYNAMRDWGIGPKPGPGMASDFIAVILYLVFTYSREAEIIN